MITPQVEAPEIAKELGIPKLYLKREDLHLYGSHKGRSIAAMIDKKAFQGAERFAISSSGNAAIAAARHIQKKNLEGSNLSLTIFAGERMNPEKKKLLTGFIDDKITLETTPRPLQSLFNLLKGGKKIESLRQSTDPDALEGYKILAEEIEPTPDLKAVFIGTSSGTAAEAIAKKLIEDGRDVELHIVQTPDVSPISGTYDEREDAAEKSLADAIVDKIAHRKEEIDALIKKTNGSGWVAGNEDIREAIRLLREKAGIEATGNGALGLAGLVRAVRKGRRFQGAVVCIITGK